MTATLERRLSVVEHRMRVGTGPLANFSDADLLAAVEWVIAALGENGRQILAREDVEEAKLKAYYEQPDVAFAPDLKQGWRWPYQRARALEWERTHPGPRSAATPEELQAKIHLALDAMRRAS
jgi:hypothetical protein